MAFQARTLGKVAAVLAIAAALALLCAIPSLGVAQQASAQGYVTCPNGQVYPASFGNQYCSNASSGYVICDGNAVPTGTACTTSSTQYCGTSVVPPGSYCCPNGNVIPIGAMCTYTPPQYCGSTLVPAGEYCCPNGTAIPIGAMCTNSPPQYCGSTLVPTGDSCCANGVLVTYGQPCTDSGGTVCGNTIVYYPQTCQSQTCPNGTVVYPPNACPSVTACPGGGNVYSPETCPTAVNCSNGTFVYAPNTCPTSQLTYCANGVTVALGQSCPSVTVSNPTPAGLAVTYTAGWNLVGGPAGTIVSGNVGPLYAFRAGDSSYEVVASGTPLSAGTGYWAYFSQTTSSSLASAGSNTMTAQLPPGQFVMVGNPGTTSATVSGADIVYTYSASGGYQRVSALAPGQGAWAFSANGAVVSISSSAN